MVPWLVVQSVLDRVVSPCCLSELLARDRLLDPCSGPCRSLANHCWKAAHSLAFHPSARSLLRHSQSLTEFHLPRCREDLCRAEAEYAVEIWMVVAVERQKLVRALQMTAQRKGLGQSLEGSGRSPCRDRILSDKDCVDRQATRNTQVNLYHPKRDSRTVSREMASPRCPNRPDRPLWLSQQSAGALPLPTSGEDTIPLSAGNQS